MPLWNPSPSAPIPTYCSWSKCSMNHIILAPSPYVLVDLRSFSIFCSSYEVLIYLLHWRFFHSSFLTEYLLISYGSGYEIRHSNNVVFYTLPCLRFILVSKYHKDIDLKGCMKLYNYVKIQKKNIISLF